MTPAKLANRNELKFNTHKKVKARKYSKCDFGPSEGHLRALLYSLWKLSSCFRPQAHRTHAVCSCSTPGQSQEALHEATFGAKFSQWRGRENNIDK